MSRLLAILVAIGVSACGMKGSLMLPPGPPPEPLLGYPKPPTAAKTAPEKPANSDKDANTDKTTASPQ